MFRKLDFAAVLKLCQLTETPFGMRTYPGGRKAVSVAHRGAWYTGSAPVQLS